ncbi:four-carbon acid sugar kinase family protein [Bacteroidota bacterium]
MIAIIADDFTGAAELSGLGLRYGLKVEIDTKVPKSTNVDLLVIPTDTRLVSAEEAYNRVNNAVEDLNKLGAKWIFKKIDSIMRGQVSVETMALMNASGKNKILCVPANPTLGRTIKDGTYFVRNKELHETNLSKIPGFDYNSSKVLDFLKPPQGLDKCVLKAGDEISFNSICIGEASSFKDVENWAKKVNDEIIPVGAADFFTALLKVNSYKVKIPVEERIIELGNKSLFVFGSAYIKSRNFISEAKKHGCCVSEIPVELFKNNGEPEKYIEQWAYEIVNMIRKCSRVIVAINRPYIRLDSFSHQIRNYQATAVQKALQVVDVNELIIEGGATVSSVLNKVGIQKFIPTQELSHGVVRMKVEDKSDLYLTIKPGSYKWPKVLWGF